MTDLALKEVAEELRRLDPDGTRWAAVIRHTYDMVYNGRETGRYRWDQLHKTEKTHFGTLFEINAQREFQFADGVTTDFSIAGHQVDAKWSQTNGAWMLPPEVMGEIALVATGNDAESLWSLGLIRVTANNVRLAKNRDQKSQLNPRGKSEILWLWRDAELRPNVLLQLSSPDVDKIFEPRGGTNRLNELFRRAEGLIVHRSTVDTVAQQLDAQKRLRANGGSRTDLALEGYLIFSGAYHRQLAIEFDGPLLRPDEYLSLRVAPDTAENGPLIGDRHWRRARLDEAVSEPAPELPKRWHSRDDPQ